VDTIAFYFIAPEAFRIKQHVLEAVDVRERIRIVLHQLELTVARARAGTRAAGGSWPPAVSDN